jgi:hypothetical protein
MEIRGADYQNGQLNLPAGDIAVVRLTPRFHQTRLPPDISPVKYAMLNIRFDGNINNQSYFKEKVATANNFSLDKYVHYLNATGPTRLLGGRQRTHNFLVSINQTVELHLSTLKNAQGNQAKYVCYVEGHYDPANPGKWPGSQHHIQVTVKKADTSDTQVRKRHAWPALGYASYLDSQGNTSIIQSVKITGGIEVKGTIFPTNSHFRYQDNVTIGASIAVHFSHRGKMVERVVAMGYQPHLSSPLLVNFQRPDGSFQPWDGNIAHLQAKSVQVLDKTLEFEIFNGPFTLSPGHYLFYVGYRLNDGSVVFNGTMPLRFYVSP